MNRRIDSADSRSLCRELTHCDFIIVEIRKPFRAIRLMDALPGFKSCECCRVPQHRTVNGLRVKANRCCRAARIRLAGMHGNGSAKLSGSQGDARNRAIGVDEVLSETSSAYPAQGIPQEVGNSGKVEGVAFRRSSPLRYGCSSIWQSTGFQIRRLGVQVPPPVPWPTICPRRSPPFESPIEILEGTELRGHG